MRYILILLIIISFLIACGRTKATEVERSEDSVINKFMGSENVSRVSGGKEDLTVTVDISKYERSFTR